MLNSRFENPPKRAESILLVCLPSLLPFYPSWPHNSKKSTTIINIYFRPFSGII